MKTLKEQGSEPISRLNGSPPVVVVLFELCGTVAVLRRRGVQAPCKEMLPWGQQSPLQLTWSISCSYTT
jgi:hypothetical protein